MTAVDAGFAAEFVPERRDDVLLAEVGHDAVAWGPHAPAPIMLDQVNYIVWQMVDGEGSVAELVTDVHEVIGIPESLARSRIEAALATLQAGGLLESSPQPQALSATPVQDPNFLLGPPNN